MPTTASTLLNGVNLEAVGGLVDAVTADPDKARTTWAAHVDWKGGFASQSRVRGFDPQPSDEPATLGGEDSAANPVEQLLAALGNCLAVGYAANASVLGISLNDVRVDLKGDLDLRVFLGLAQGHAGFSNVIATVTVDSPASRGELEALHAKVLGSSPVGHTIGNAVPVEINLK